MVRILKIATALAIVFAGASAVAMRGTDALASIFRSAELKDFLSGTLAGKVDHAVFDAIPRSPDLNGLAAGVMYRGLGDAGPQVRAGCGDWLYSIEELRQDRRDASRIAERARLLQHIVRSFKQHGILLVIAPVPDKAEQVATELCGLSAEGSRFRREQWTLATGADASRGVDLRTGWPQPGYWRTDTHWDTIGARFAAERIAASIQQRLGSGSQNIRLALRNRQQRFGDLARLADLTEAPGWLAPAPEYEQKVAAEVVRSGSLLDEAPAPPIILAGSSFSMNSGFIEYLQASLGWEVAQVSEAGGGFAGAVLKVLQNPNMLSGVKVVIWEWPMRSLVAPLSEAEQQIVAEARTVRK